VLYIPFGPPIKNNKKEKGKTNERKRTNNKKIVKASLVPRLSASCASLMQHINGMY